MRNAWYNKDMNKILRNRKIYLIVGVFLALVFIPLGLFLLHKIPQSIPNSMVGTPPFPTFITELVIKSVTPSNGATTVNYYQPIQVVFSGPLTPDEKSSVQIQENPTVQGVLSWNGDTTLIFTPTISLLPNQKYTITITYLRKAFQTSFTTASTDTTIQKQSEADKNYSQEISKNLVQYPWLTQLPIKTDNYFVYFDLNQKQLNARIYNAPSLSQAQIDATKKEIQSRLSSLGINLNIFPVNWQLVQ